MKTCTISVYLAYTMSAYFFASIYYLIVSRFVGTPFYDSLTKKQQKMTKKQQKQQKNNKNHTFLYLFSQICPKSRVFRCFSGFEPCIILPIF